MNKNNTNKNKNQDMKYIKKLLLVALIALTSCTSTGQDTELVERVIDGDTFVMDGGERIRLLRIDTPERKEEGFQEAKDYMIARVEGKKVTLIRKGKGYYKRTLAEVYVNGVNINDELLTNGLAKLYKK